MSNKSVKRMLAIASVMALSASMVGCGGASQEEGDTAEVVEEAADDASATGEEVVEEEAPVEEVVEEEAPAEEEMDAEEGAEDAEGEADTAEGDLEQIVDDIEAAGNVELQFVPVADVHDGLDNYTVLDLRKTEDYDAGHIAGAISVDLSATVEDGDISTSGAAFMQFASDKDVVLVGDADNNYAQAAANALSALGYDMSTVYTMEGGIDAWQTDYAEELEQ